MGDNIRIDPKKLKRSRHTDGKGKDEDVKKDVSVSAGAVDKVIDLAFNPTRDKIREMTVVDRIQGRLFPQLDMLNALTHYCLEIAQYRESSLDYEKIFKKRKPVPPDALDEFIFRSAQWQKSIAGMNLERAIDIALAETEAKAGEDEFGKADDYYRD